MIYDFEQSGTAAPAPSDVCVIGAGAAGILIATQMAAAGCTVTLLEGGGLRQEPRSQEIYRSHLEGQHHQGIHAGRFRTYGGTTTRWGGQILELDAADFEKRPHVAGSGWPIAKEVLAGYYERALEFEGLRRVERDDAKVWSELRLNPIDLGPEFQMLYSRWCPERNFATLHEQELTSSPRLAIYTHANVVAFELNEARSMIEAVQVRSFGGRIAWIAARRFVLCMGGIESTRLLLQPLENGMAPWQANGTLGRQYQDHIGLNGIAISGIAAQPAWRYFGYVESRGFRYHNKIQLRHSEQQRLNTLNVACTIGPVYKENPGQEVALQALRTLVRERQLPRGKEALFTALYAPGLAANRLSQHYRGLAPEWRKTAIALHCEQSPLSASTISLADERDELGLLRTRLRWEISDEEIHSLRSFVRVASEVFSRHRFAKLHIPAGFLEDDGLVRSLCGDSNHHIGGTRMSASPSEGIVDAELKLHGIGNGYVCSASVFPCSGFSNPTHTVLALAMRLADKLILEAGRAPVLAPRINPMRQITLPGTSPQTSQLGFGCAYLLGPGLDRATSRRLLDAAYDAGIRHFDTARLYGQGHCEALLGDFLRDHPHATVTTKFGLIPPNLAERAVAAAQRRLPGMPKALANLRRREKATFNAAEAKASLELSLRLLRRERIDLLLLHEPDVDDLCHDDLLAFLERQKAAGTIGAFGIGGEYARMQSLYDTRREYAQVLQYEWSIFGPRLDVPTAAQVHYRTFARPAQKLMDFFRSNPELALAWSERTGADLNDHRVLSRLLLKASLEDCPETLTLFSTRREAHIFDNAAVAGDDKLIQPALKLRDLIREDSVGLPEILYPAYH